MENTSIPQKGPVILVRTRGPSGSMRGKYPSGKIKDNDDKTNRSVTRMS